MAKCEAPTLTHLPLSVRKYIQLRGQTPPIADLHRVASSGLRAPVDLAHLAPELFKPLQPAAARRRRRKLDKQAPSHPCPQPDGSRKLQRCTSKKAHAEKVGMFPSLPSVDCAGRRTAIGALKEKGHADKLIDAMRSGESIISNTKDDLPTIPIRGHPAQHTSFRAAKQLAQAQFVRVKSSVRTKGYHCLVAKSGVAFNVRDDDAELTEQTGMLRRHVSWCGKQYRKVVKNGDPGLLLRGFQKLMSRWRLSWDPKVVDQTFKVLCSRGVDFMTFAQFVGMFALFSKGSREDQARVLFKIIDVSHDGTLSQFEMLHFFVANLESKEEAQQATATVNEMMNKIDNDGAGATLQQFVSKVNDDDHLWSCFQKLSPFTPLLAIMDRDSHIVLK